MAISGGTRHIATALGVLTASGQLNQAFFESPFDTVAVMISDPQRRSSLLRALDELLEVNEQAGPPDQPAVRAYPLVNLDSGGLLLGVLAEGNVTQLSLMGRIQVDSAVGLGIHVDIPLVRAVGATVAAVTGTEDGPVRVGAACSIADGATVTADALVGTTGGDFAVRVTGLVIDGQPVPPVELRRNRW